MRVSSVSSGGGYQVSDSIEIIQRNLAAIASFHNVSVEELVSSANSAGVDGPRYLARVLTMVRRLDKLQGND